MGRRFRIDASKKITAADIRVLAENNDAKTPEEAMIEQVEDLQDRVSDDFDYVLTGIERLSREGMHDGAISLLTTLADTLDSAISIIGNQFEENKSIDSYTDEFNGLEEI